MSDPESSRNASFSPGNAIFLLAALCGIATFAFLMCDRYTPASTAAVVPVEQRFEQAMQAYHHQDRAQAIAQAEQVIQQQPTHKEAHKLLASCYAQNGNLSAAAGEYNRAVQIDHDDMEAELLLAATLERLGSRAEAREAYHVVADNPQSSSAQRGTAKNQLRGL